MPRILRIINRFNLGGPTYNVAYLTRYLTPYFETLLIGGMKDASEESSEFIVRNLGIEPLIIPEMRREINPIKDWVAYHKIIKIIKEYKPDIVHTHAAKAGTLGRLAAIQCKIPIIVHTFHGHVFHSYFGKLQTTVYKSIERYLAEKTTAIVGISEKQKEELSGKYRICSSEKIYVIPLGFDLERFTSNQQEKRNKFRELYRLESDEIAIGIIGRLVPVKNHFMFLEAIKILMDNPRLKFRAFIIGDGESKEEIIQKANDLKIPFSIGNTPSLISFTSWIKEIDLAYAGLDIIALTSYNEGTPVSLIESQAAGKPVVSTNVGGIENVVLDHQTGLLSPVNNPVEFSKNLLRLLEDAPLRQRFGVKGKEFVLGKFNYHRLALDMKCLYHKLLKSNKF